MIADIHNYGGKKKKVIAKLLEELGREGMMMACSSGGRQMKAFYWFRRDLRVGDNRALAKAVSEADRVAAIFVIDSDTLEYWRMSFNDPRFTFLLDALRNLDAKIRLHVFYGRTREIFEHLLGRYRFDAVYTAASLSWSEDFMVQEVKEICRRNGVKFVETVDNVLVDPSLVGSHVNFTTFYRRWRKLVDAQTIGEPSSKVFIDVDEPSLEELCEKHGWKIPEDRMWRVDWCNRRLQSFDFRRYAAAKDYPHLDGTSKLSPYISLGVVSVRDLFDKAVGVSEEFVRQLAWR
ncbi:MAG: deoxyribodipyrimidine photo-lyase, partial [Candidatus Bathyarchaeia archaeon]